MPTYEYRCKECGYQFTEVLSLGEHDKYKPHCPKCKSTNVEQLFSAFFAKTSKKS
ncbi:MAG: zinc ribbon domain-containing protein [candidate division KSB1 bacterium]|nr:zinc ribbon domain-containing protein [candidate division KSB1 bacterium]